ncbi:MAG: hypothetical protein IJB09_06605 [Oscillospiraceae bacterium]|nr:hypothetical protein [Oscillospiraceae bacterium]
MRRVWPIVMTVVLIVVLIGAVSVGVGLITGANMDRVFNVLDNQYNLTIYYEYITGELIPALLDAGIIVK